MPSMAKYQLWQYRDNNNCWDFVRTVLNQEFGLSLSNMPKFGICPTDATLMNNAYNQVKGAFYLASSPVSGAIACHFTGKALAHVGVVVNGFIWHVGSKTGVRKDTPKTFQRIAKTEYWHWQH